MPAFLSVTVCDTIHMYFQWILTSIVFVRHGL